MRKKLIVWDDYYFVGYDLIDVLRQWLLEHILKEDKKFASYFKEQNIELNLIDIN